MIEDLTLHFSARDQIIHAVEAADVGALAAARRPDESSDLIFIDRHVDTLKRELPAVADVQLIDRENRRSVWCRSCPCGGHLEMYG